MASFASSATPGPKKCNLIFLIFGRLFCFFWPAFGHGRLGHPKSLEYFYPKKKKRKNTPETRCWSRLRDWTLAVQKKCWVNISKSNNLCLTQQNKPSQWFWVLASSRHLIFKANFKISWCSIWRSLTLRFVYEIPFYLQTFWMCQSIS